VGSASVTRGSLRGAGRERQSGILGLVRGLVLVLVVIVLAVVGLIGWAISINNQLVTLEQNVNEKWAQVQNVYQRRADLIPNLVETVKGFAAQERTVLNEVTQARASATQIRLTPEALNDPQALQKFQAVQNQLSGALSRLLVTVERYPELKSNANFLALQTQLEGTENRISIERQRYNEAVREYNTRLRLFPGSLVAGLMGFRPKAFFEATPESATPPKVKF
jgi:LemA protein